METMSVPAFVAPDELLKLDDGKLYELIDGNLVEKNMGAEANEVTVILTEILSAFNRKHKLGHLYSEQSILCFPKYPGRTRRPDICFVKSGRYATGKPPKGHIEIAPDLAVEVVSPNDSYYEVDAKVYECLEAGIKEVWLINPELKKISIIHPDNVVTLVAAGILTTDLLPGFALNIAELFEII